MPSLRRKESKTSLGSLDIAREAGTASRACWALFCSKDILLHFALLCGLALWWGSTSARAIPSPINTMATLIASLAGALSISISWKNAKEALCALLALPLHRPLLSLAYCLVGCFTSSVQFALPVVLVGLASDGGPTGIDVVSTLLMSLEAGFITFLFSILAERWAILVSIPASMLLYLASRAGGAAAATIVFVLMVAAVLNGTKGTFLIAEKRAGTSFRSLAIGDHYYPSAFLADKMGLLNWSGLLLIGCVTTLVLRSDNVNFPLGQLFAVACTQLNTLLSREPDTYRQLLLVWKRPKVYIGYFCFLSLCSSMFLVVQTGVVGIAGQNELPFLGPAICSSAVANALAVALEVYFPLHDWKTEGDVLTNPRKYLPLVANAMVLGLAYALT